MIVASRFGWAAVSSEPMDWTEFHLARQLVAEEVVGKAVRQSEYDEEAAFQAARRSLGG